MRIVVSAENIRDGIVSTRSCPVAKALEDAGYPLSRIHVGSRYLWGRSLIEDSMVFVELPKEVAERVAHYTRTEEMEPFEFHI